MKKQLSLGGLFQGKHEVVEEKPKNKVGRPPKKRVEDNQDEEPQEKRKPGIPRKHQISEAEEEQLNDLLETFNQEEGFGAIFKQVKDAANEHQDHNNKARSTSFWARSTQPLVSSG